MTLQEFLEKWNGELCEVSGSANAKNQCVDLANAYLRDVCNHSIVEWTNACDFPSKIKDMEWIVNDEETDLPKEGDIIIWSNKVGGGAGHIAIFLDGTTSKFNSFDQNWPLYSPCHVQSHSYLNVIGWMRPKSIINDMTEEQKRILDFIGTRTEGEVRQAFGALSDLPNLNKEIESLKSSHDSMEERLAQLEADSEANNKLILSWQNQVSTANKKNSKLQADLDSATAQSNVWKNRYENALTQFPSKYNWKDIINLIINKFKK